MERDVSNMLPAEQKGRRRPYVVVLSGPDAGAIHRLDGPSTLMGRGSGCDITLHDDGLSRRHARLICGATGVVGVEDLGSTNGTFVEGEKVTSTRLRDGDRFQLGEAALLKFSLSDEFDDAFVRKLQESSVVDRLTGTYLREHLEQHLASEVSFSQRHGTSLALILVGMDHFGLVNETFGRVAGDSVLREVGAVLRGEVRSHDFVARFGGDHFAVLTRGITADQAGVLAARLRASIESMVVRWKGREVKVTASLGVAALWSEAVESAEGLIVAAAEALDDARSQGRNRVAIAR